MSNLSQTGFKNRGIDCFLSNMSTDNLTLGPANWALVPGFYDSLGFASPTLRTPTRLVWDRPCPRTPKKRGHFLYHQCFLNEAKKPSPELLKRFRPGFIRQSGLRQCLLCEVGYQATYSRLCHILNSESCWCTNIFFFYIEWPSWLGLSSASHHPHRLGLHLGAASVGEGQRENRTLTLMPEGYPSLLLTLHCVKQVPCPDMTSIGQGIMLPQR